MNASGPAYSVEDPSKIQGRDEVFVESRDLGSLRLRHALEAIAETGGRLLLLGAGAGRYARAIARYRPDLDVIAGDLSQVAVQEAADHGGPPLYLVLNAQEIPFADESFSAVLFFDLLEHVPDPRAMIEDSCRVLVPGGVLHFFVPLEAEPGTLYSLLADDEIGIPIHRWKREHVGHIQRFRRADVLRMVWSSGLLVTQARSSFHLVGQVHDIVDYWHRERQAGGAGRLPLRTAEHITRATFLLTWRLAWLEDRLFQGRRFASGLHVTARKPDEPA